MKMKKTITKKIIRVNVLIVIVSLLLMSIISSITIKKYLENEIAQDLLNETRLFRRMSGFEVKNNRHDKSERETLDNSEFRLARREFESQVIILSQNRNGELNQVYNSSKEARLSNKDIMEIKKAINKGKQYFEIFLDDKNCLAAITKAKQMKIKNKLVNGYMIAYIPTTHMDRINRDIIKVLMITTLIVGSVSILIGLSLSKKITKPIVKLTKIAEKLSNREFENKAIIKTGDEIEILATAVNKMSDNILKYDNHQKEFFQNISHELKTPLMSIQGYAEGVKDGVFDSEDQALNVIIDESKRIKKIVEDIIYLSKLDMIDEKNIESKECSMNQLIINSIEKIESIAIQSDIDIFFNPKEDVLLYIDEEKIIRVMINILSNCLKYTKSMIEVDTGIDQKFFTIKIIDDGNGFSDKDLENLFDRFYKGEKKGSGLGMSIVKKIMESHKGHIEVRNNCSGGAEFILKFPI